MAMYTSSYINKALAVMPEGPRHEVPTEGQKTLQPAVARLEHMHISVIPPLLRLLTWNTSDVQADSGFGRAVYQAFAGVVFLTALHCMGHQATACKHSVWRTLCCCRAEVIQQHPQMHPFWNQHRLLDWR